MKEKLRFLGLDVHAKTIAVAIAEPDGEVRSLGTIPNRLESVGKLIKKLHPPEKLRVCAETRREHALELQAIFGFQPFTIKHYGVGVRSLQELALQTDKGLLLASALIEGFRLQQVPLPTLNRIERICAEAVTRANRSIYSALSRLAHGCSPRTPGQSA
jgi:Domain of unknown function (DUF4158)